jgi:energy-coupling factor transporter transmembrane protein EcfT
MTSFLTPLPCPDSPLRRFDPRWKLAALTIALTTTACLQTIPPAAVALISAIILAYLARIPIQAYLERLTIILPALVLFIIFLPFVVPDPEPIFFGPVRL